MHGFLNLSLGVGSVLITWLAGTPFFGVLLVVLSKWRTFAVRPRYWWLNIRSNLVDFIVGLSFVLIAYASGTTFQPIHVLLALGYSVWLLFVKPRRSPLATEVQSLCAVFLGSAAAIFMLAGLSDSWPLVLVMFVIGYAAARHVLVQSSDSDYALIPFLVGLIFAEFTLFLSSWLIVYSFTSIGLIIPQLSIILTLFLYAAGHVYRSIITHDGKLKFSDIAAPTIFSVLVSLVIFVGFSQPIFNV